MQLSSMVDHSTISIGGLAIYGVVVFLPPPFFFFLVQIGAKLIVLQLHPAIWV